MTMLPEKLLTGYRTFMAQRYANETMRYRQLAEQGQTPETLVIACCDSRAAPEIIFDTSPGEIFVIRNVANLVPPYQPDSAYHGVSAALEFAVTQLEVKEIVVLGHGFCGGCAAALTGQFDEAAHGAGHFIAHWIDMLTPARAEVRARHAELDRRAFEDMEHEGVRASLTNLRTFPWVADRVADGRVTLHGGWFSIESGELHLLNEDTGAFAPA